MYTSAEIQASVEKLIRTTVSTPVDSLGARRTDITFTELQEAAAGIFILYVNAPLYVAHLASRRVEELVEATDATLSELLDTTRDLSRTTRPVDNLTGLGNAEVALSDLNRAVGGRDTGFPDIEQVPAFRRYVANLDSFINAYGPNVRKSGTIVDTPQSARERFAGLLSSLNSNYIELRRVVTLLANSLDDFESLHLPQVVARGVMSRAQEVLGAHILDLNGLTPNERLTSLKELVLDLLAQKAVVRKYGAALGPSRYHLLGDIGLPYSDSTHLATPARLPAAVPGPYITFSGQDTIEIAMDMGAYQNLAFPHGFVAEINATLAKEPYEITSGVNDTLNLNIDGINVTIIIPETPWYIDELHGGDSLRDLLNPQLAPYGVEIDGVITPLKLDTLFDITSLGGNNARFIPVTGSLDGFNIQLTDVVRVTDGVNAGTVWTITAVTSTHIDAFSVPVTPDTAFAKVGPFERELVIRYFDPATALQGRKSITLVSDAGGTGDECLRTLGFIPSLSSSSRPVLAKNLADFINLQVANIRGEVDQVNIFDGVGRTDPSDSTVVYFYRASCVGDVDGATPNQVVITNVVLTSGEYPVIGDKLVFRSGLNANLIGEVTNITSDTVTASIAGSANTSIDISFETLPDITPDFGYSIFPLDGPNPGEYPITNSPGADIFKYQLERAFPVYRFGPTPITFAARLCQQTIVFVSKLPQVSSEVKIRTGLLAELLFGPIPPV